VDADGAAMVELMNEMTMKGKTSLVKHNNKE
jgi:hypothetical protein